MFFLSHCCQSPFPRWESQSTCPPQDALQHCADLWTRCGGSSDSNLVLLLCSCLQCPQLTGLVRFLLWEPSVPLHTFHRHTVCPVDHLDWICSLYSWWEGFGSSSSVTLPLGFIVVLFPPLHVGQPLRFAPEAALEGLGLPQGGPGVEVVQLLGSQGFWQHQVLRGVGG